MYECRGTLWDFFAEQEGAPFGEYGSGICKTGFASKDNPRAVFPPTLGIAMPSVVVEGLSLTPQSSMNCLTFSFPRFIQPAEECLVSFMLEFATTLFRFLVCSLSSNSTFTTLAVTSTFHGLGRKKFTCDGCTVYDPV